MKSLLIALAMAASISAGPFCADEPIIGAWAGSTTCDYSIWEIWPGGDAQHFCEHGYTCYRWERTGITQQGRELYLFVQVRGSSGNPVPGTASLYYYDEAATALVCADTGDRFR